MHDNYRERVTGTKFVDALIKDTLEEINNHLEIESDKFGEWRVILRTETVIPRNPTKILAFGQ